MQEMQEMTPELWQAVYGFGMLLVMVIVAAVAARRNRKGGE